MVKKWIIWFLALAFLNLSIAPDFAFGFYDQSAGAEGTGIVVAGIILVSIIILAVGSIVKHKKEPPEQPKDQEHDTKMSSELKLDNQHLAQILCETNYDNQRAPSGEIVLVSW